MQMTSPKLVSNSSSDYFPSADPNGSLYPQTRNSKLGTQKMRVLIVGSTALDSIKTPHAENPRLLGGSASHAAVAASFFGPVRLVGVVGQDFPKRYIQLYRRHGLH